MELKFNKIIKLIVIAGASGVGKNTQINLICEYFKETFNVVLARSVSVTNRPPREGEIDGIDYFFVTTEQFMEYVRQGKFLEWEPNNNGSYYGTLLSEIEKISKGDVPGIVDVNASGAIAIKRELQSKAIIFYLSALSKVREERIKNRGKNAMTKNELQKRLLGANKEDWMMYWRFWIRVWLRTDFLTPEKIREKIIEKLFHFMF